jgi:hypothetical protein
MKGLREIAKDNELAQKKWAASRGKKFVACISGNWGRIVVYGAGMLAFSMLIARLFSFIYN